MNAFAKRIFIPIALILLGFLAFGLVKNSAEIFLFFVIFLALFRIFAPRVVRKSKNLNTVCALALAAAVLGTSASGVLLYRNEQLVDTYSGEHTIGGYVSEVSGSYAHMSECVVRVEQVDGERASFSAVLVIDFPSELSLGDFFECNVTITPFAQNEEYDYLKNTNHFDYPVLCVAKDDSALVKKESQFRLDIALSDLNDTISSAFFRVMPKESASLASALLLGNRHLLEDDTLRDFKRAGVYHMLALSGLHVAILIGLLEDFLRRRVCMMRGKRSLILTAIALFYLALTGFQISACRSVIMLLILYISYAVHRRRDSLTSLFAAVCVIAIISPASLFDVGLQLSALSTFGIIAASMIRRKMKFFTRPIFGWGIVPKIKKLARGILYLGLCSVCVFIATLPIVSEYFGEVSLATFVTNLFMGAVCECFMIISLLVLCLLGIPIIGVMCGAISGFVGNLMLTIVRGISDIRGVMLSLEYPFVDVLVWVVFVASLILFGIKLKRKIFVALPSAIFVVLLMISIVFHNAVRDDFVCAEFAEGDSLILSSADGVYICDASEGRYGALFDAFTLAKKNCFTEIDGVVLTHYHSYHSSSLVRIANNYKLHSVYLPHPQNETEAIRFEEIYNALSKKGVAIYLFDATESLGLLGGELVVSPGAYGEHSHPSVALSYSYGDSRISLVERPFFGSHLEDVDGISSLISQSDVVIFGSDGRAPDKEFELFYRLKLGAEVVFAEKADLLLSDIEAYLSDFTVYTDAEYKKYDLK